MDEKWKKEEGHFNLNQQETHQQLKAKKEEEKKWEYPESAVSWIPGTRVLVSGQPVTGVGVWE